MHIKIIGDEVVFAPNKLAVTEDEAFAITNDVF